MSIATLTDLVNNSYYTLMKIGILTHLLRLLKLDKMRELSNLIGTNRLEPPLTNLKIMLINL